MSSPAVLGTASLEATSSKMSPPQISGAWGEPQEALGHPKGVLFLGERPVSEYNPGASESQHVAKWEDGQWPHAAQGEEKLG